MHGHILDRSQWLFDRPFPPLRTGLNAQSKGFKTLQKEVEDIAEKLASVQDQLTTVHAQFVDTQAQLAEVTARLAAVDHKGNGTSSISRDNIAEIVA